MGKKLTTQEFIEKARNIHGDKYDYSNVEYVNNKTKVCITCLKHGEFLIRPDHFLCGVGCSKCSGNSKRTIESFINDAKKVHEDKYDYSESELVNVNSPMKIICKVHGAFMQRPNDHLRGCGCPHCKGDSFVERIRLPFDEVMRRSNQIHDKKYTYDKSSYVNTMTKMRIVCPIHGEFWQVPSSHMVGVGCPKCNYSKLEKLVHKLLSNNGIDFIAQCGKTTFKWLGMMSLDFFIPQHNIAIECQGRQHYELVTFFGGREGFETVKERDKRKKQLCEEHGVKLLYFADKQYEDNVITNEQKLIEEITRQ